MTDSTSIPEHLTQDNNEPKTKVVAILLADGWHKVDGYAATSDLIGTFYAVLPDDSRLRGPLTSVLAVREVERQQTVMVDPKVREAREHRRRAAMNAVLDAMAEHIEPVTLADLDLRLPHLTRDTLHRLLERLIATGLVIRTGTATTRRYALAQDETKAEQMSLIQEPEAQG